MPGSLSPLTRWRTLQDLRHENDLQRKLDSIDDRLDDLQGTAREILGANIFR